MLPNIAESMILTKTRMAFARYKPTSQVMSLVKQEVTMITSDGSHRGCISLMNKYTNRRKDMSCTSTNNLVEAKNNSVASAVVNLEECK